MEADAPEGEVAEAVANSDLSPAAALLQPELVELIETKQYRELHESLEGLPAADVADLIYELEVPQAAVAFRLLPRDEAGDVFAELDAERQQALIEELGERRAMDAIEALDPDDRARFLDELPSEVSKELIRSLSPESRRETQAILGYPPDSVGRLMTPDYVRVRPDWTVQKALDHIREWGKDAETVHWVYVIDSQYRLIDDLHIRTLLLADPGALISDVMDDQFIALGATDDREEAVRMLLRYDRTALPVLDSRSVLLGIVTHDDVADVAEEEATEDIQKLGGMQALERPYMQTSLMNMIQKRGGWLLALLFVQVFTIGVLELFEAQLAQTAVLVAFIPLIIASGGNTGTQAASLLIRALAIGEVEPPDWRRVLVKELLTGLSLGALLGVAAGAIVFGLSMFGIAEHARPDLIGLTVGLSILMIVIWGVLLGSLFPLILEKLGLDPATISSPLVATLMDVSGLVIYLSVAAVLLVG